MPRILQSLIQIGMLQNTRITAASVSPVPGRKQTGKALKKEETEIDVANKGRLVFLLTVPFKCMREREREEPTRKIFQVSNVRFVSCPNKNACSIRIFEPSITILDFYDYTSPLFIYFFIIFHYLIIYPQNFNYFPLLKGRFFIFYF